MQFDLPQKHILGLLSRPKPQTMLNISQEAFDQQPGSPSVVSLDVAEIISRTSTNRKGLIGHVGSGIDSFVGAVDKTIECQARTLATPEPGPGHSAERGMGVSCRDIACCVHSLRYDFQNERWLR